MRPTSIRSGLMSFAAMAALTVTTVQAGAEEVFEHYGWKGYVVGSDQMGGCRMSKRIGNGLHALAHQTANGTFLIGFVDARANFYPGERLQASARFDGRFFALGGSADNPRLVTFGYSDSAALMRAFRTAARMRLDWSDGGWIEMGLKGTKGATDRLRRCAAYAAQPVAPPVTSYAPSLQGNVLADTDLPGYDYRRLDGIGMSQCVAACASDGGCRAATYNANKWVCFLKGGVGRATRHNGALSWIK